MFQQKLGAPPLRPSRFLSVNTKGNVSNVSFLQQVFQRLRLSNGDESAALRELLNWRRAQCEGRTDWRRRASQSPPLPPTLLWTNRKASPWPRSCSTPSFRPQPNLHLLLMFFLFVLTLFYWNLGQWLQLLWTMLQLQAQKNRKRLQPLPLCTWLWRKPIRNDRNPMCSFDTTVWHLITLKIELNIQLLSVHGAEMRPYSTIISCLQISCFTPFLCWFLNLIKCQMWMRCVWKKKKKLPPVMFRLDQVLY